MNNPWQLQTALDHPSAVQPGDTIWLRGRHLQRPALHEPPGRDLGRPDHRPPVPRRAGPDRRQLQRQRDHADHPRQVHLVLGLRDLQLRSHPMHPDGELPPRRGTGVQLSGDGTRMINMVIHDTSQGVLDRRRPRPTPASTARSSTTTATTRRIAATATASTPRTSARRPSRSTTTSCSSSSAGASTRTARAATWTTSTSRATSPSTTAGSRAAGTPTSSWAVPRTSRPIPS